MSEKGNSRSLEKRRFFRVDAELQLSFEPLGAAEIALQKQRSAKNLHGLSQLDIDERIERLLGHLQGKHPVLHELMTLLNDKIDYIARQHGVEEMPEVLAPSQMFRVNLSACGIAFTVDTPYEVNAYMRLHLKLPEKPLNMMARVVDCSKTASNQFRLRMDYVNLPIADQDVIIRYVMQCDAQNLRSRFRM